MSPSEAIALSYLESLGWSHTLQAEYESNHEAGTVPARIAAEYRGQYSIIDDTGVPYRAVLSGRMLANTRDRPAVGDWVDVRRDLDGTSVVVRRYERATELVRRAAGKQTRAQVIAANVDVIFVTTWPTGDFNPRRIERYLTAAWEGGASPVIVLTKLDLCDDPAPYLEALEEVAFGVPVELVCAPQGTGIEALQRHLGRGRTGAFVGSSGVGKSTLVNAILGADVQLTGGVRESDARGRHITSHRELFVTDAGVIIDTPGMRELGLWADTDAVNASYVDIDSLAEECKFRDCKHHGEPGCAVQEAVDAGELDEGRLASYDKLGRELAHMDRKRDAMARHELRLQGKRFGRIVKEAKRIKAGNK